MEGIPACRNCFGSQSPGGQTAVTECPRCCSQRERTTICFSAPEVRELEITWRMFMTVGGRGGVCHLEYVRAPATQDSLFSRQFPNIDVFKLQNAAMMLKFDLTNRIDRLAA